MRKLALGNCLRHLQIFHGEGRRRRHAGVPQKESRHRLVDAALDRLRRIPYRNGEPFQCMQDTEPTRDRLERSGCDRADKHRIRQSAAEGGDRDAGWPFRIEADRGERGCGHNGAAPSQPCAETLGLHAGRVACDEDAQLNGMAAKRNRCFCHRSPPPSVLPDISPSRGEISSVNLAAQSATLTIGEGRAAG